MQYKGFNMTDKLFEASKYSKSELKTLEMFEDVFYNSTSAKLQDSGREKIMRAIKHFGAREVLISLEIAIDQYYDGEKDSVANVFNKIPGILVVRAKKDKHSYVKYYIRKAFKENFGEFNDNNYFYLIDKALNNNTSEEVAEFIKEECLTCDDFQELIEYLEGIVFQFDIDGGEK